MQERSILFRILALPLRHKLTAATIAIAIAGGFFVWGRRAAERYASPALLSFDASTVRHAETGEAQPSAITLAQSILSDEQVTVLTSHFDISHPSDESSIKVFRSHLKLDELGPTILRLQYLDSNGMQAVAMTNAIVEVLTAWTPVETTITPQPAVTSPPVKTTRPKSVSIRAMHTSLRPDVSVIRMQAQLNAIDQRLTTIESERQKVNATKVNHPVVERQNGTRQALEAQLAVAQKKLEDLRVRYTEEYPDVGTAQEHVHDLQQQLAALSAGHSGETASTVNPPLDAVTREASQLRLEREHLTREIIVEKKRARVKHDDVDAVQAQSSGGISSDVPSLTTSPSTEARAKTESPTQAPVSQLTMSPFTLLQQSSYAVSGSGKPGSAMWLGMLLALVCALVYLGLAVRWYKPVHDETMLTQAVSAEVMYMGTVPRMNL